MNTALFQNKFFSRNICIFIIGLSVAVLCALLPTEYSTPFFIIFSGLLLGAFIISVDSPGEFNKIFFLFIAGFLIRILISVLLYFFLDVSQINSGFFIGDGENYSLNGWRISRLWELGLKVNKSNFVSAFGSFSGTIGNYDFLNAFIYSISGYSPLSLFFINCLAGSLHIIVIFIISNKIFNIKIALLSSAFCAFLPSFILWSSQNLKDPLTNLGILFSLYLFIKLRHDIKISSILFLILTFIGLYYLRMLTVAPLALILLFYFLFLHRSNVWIKFVLIIFMVILSLFLFKHIFSSQFILNSLQEINANRHVRAYGNLAYFPDFRISSLGSLFAYLPLGFLAVWLSPFPWQVFSLSQIFVLPEILVWYIFIPFAMKGIHLAIKDRIKDSYFIIATIFVFSLFLGVYEGNLGTLYRHKAIVIMLVYIFVSAGLLTKQKIEVV